MRKWIMMNKNGQSTKERRRNQTRLLGRGKRVRSGIAPSRGKGRTAHGRR